MAKQKEEKKKKEKSLLQNLCGSDDKLYGFLSRYLYEDPLSAISEKNLDTLTEEAEKSGGFRPAMDKAIFEASQNADEKERYIEIIQNLASKTIDTMEQKKAKMEQEGHTDLAASLGRRIEGQQFIREKTENIIDIASKFYNEKLLELGETIKREERKAERKEAEKQERKIEQQEKTRREARQEERKDMGREERREAEKQDKKKELEAEERKKAREEERKEAEKQERRIEQQEKAGREARKEERREH